MKKNLLYLLLIFLFSGQIQAQEKTLLPYFNVDLSTDLYYVNDLNFKYENYEQTGLRNYAAVGSVPRQFRFQAYEAILNFQTEEFWASIGIQNGDGPQLLASSGSNFIGLINKAFFGFKVTPKWSFETGYMSNPIGMESSKPVFNMISSVSMGGYFQPGSLLGLRLNYHLNDYHKFSAIYYNSYSYYKQQDTTLSQPSVENLMLSYHHQRNRFELAISSSYADIGGRLGKYTPQKWYNNIYGKLFLMEKKIELGFQTDFVGQRYTGRTDSTTGFYAFAFSGLVQGKYAFTPQWSVAARFDYFADPHAVLSQKQTNGKGIVMIEPFVGLEYRPFPICYFRTELGYAMEVQEQKIYNKNTYQNRFSLMFTTGYYFNSKTLKNYLPLSMKL